MDEVRIPLESWTRCKDQMAEAAAIYAAAIPLIGGTDQGRRLAVRSLDHMAELLQEVYGDLFQNNRR